MRGRDKVLCTDASFILYAIKRMDVDEDNERILRALVCNYASRSFSRLLSCNNLVFSQNAHTTNVAEHTA